MHGSEQAILEVPARQEFVAVARQLVGAMATNSALAAHQQQDLVTAAGELLVVLMQETVEPSAPLRVRVVRRPDRLRVFVSWSGRMRDALPPECPPIHHWVDGWSLFEACVDRWRPFRAGRRCGVAFEKEARPA